MKVESSINLQMAKFFKEVLQEGKKVTWPSFKSSLHSLFYVMMFVVFMGLILSLVDYISYTLVNFLSFR